MKLRALMLCLIVFITTAISVYASTGNEAIRAQMYNVIRTKPYFNTTKPFIDNFITELNTINYSSEKAVWRTIDERIAVDETSFKEINGIYYLVFKTRDDGIIGLVRFKCKTNDNGGFKKIQSFNYKKLNAITEIDENRFNLIEEAACEP